MCRYGVLFLHHLLAPLEDYIRVEIIFSVNINWLEAIDLYSSDIPCSICL